MPANPIPTHRSTGRRLIDWAREQLSSGAGALHALDQRTLSDIGVDASEIASIEAESRGDAYLTRLRIVNGW